MKNKKYNCQNGDSQQFNKANKQISLNSKNTTTYDVYNLDIDSGTTMWRDLILNGILIVSSWYMLPNGYTYTNKRKKCTYSLSLKKTTYNH